MIFDMSLVEGCFSFTSSEGLRGHAQTGGGLPNTHQIVAESRDHHALPNSDENLPHEQTVISFLYFKVGIRHIFTSPTQFGLKKRLPAEFRSTKH